MEATATSPIGWTKSSSSSVSGWDLLVALTVRDVKVRYQATFFSFVWWVARPLAMGLVLYFALGRVLQVSTPNYGVFIMSGLFTWFWFSGAVTGASSSIINNAGLIKKMRFPRLILPLSAVFFNTMQFLFTLPMITIFVLVSHLTPSPVWLIGIPILLVLQTLLLIGLGTLLAAVNVFFRDLGPLLDVAMLLMFYLTPIIYPLSRVPKEFRPFIRANPAAPLLESWRELFLNNNMPGIDLWPAVLAAAVFLVVGLAAFAKLEKYFADAL